MKGASGTVARTVLASRPTSFMMLRKADVECPAGETRIAQVFPFTFFQDQSGDAELGQAARRGKAGDTAAHGYDFIIVKGTHGAFLHFICRVMWRHSLRRSELGTGPGGTHNST